MRKALAVVLCASIGFASLGCGRRINYIGAPVAAGLDGDLTISTVGQVATRSSMDFLIDDKDNNSYVLWVEKNVCDEAVDPIGAIPPTVLSHAPMLVQEVRQKDKRIRCTITKDAVAKGKAPVDSMYMITTDPDKARRTKIGVRLPVPFRMVRCNGC